MRNSIKSDTLSFRGRKYTIAYELFIVTLEGGGSQIRLLASSPTTAGWTRSKGFKNRRESGFKRSEFRRDAKASLRAYLEEELEVIEKEMTLAEVKSGVPDQSKAKPLDRHGVSYGGHTYFISRTLQAGGITGSCEDVPDWNYHSPIGTTYTTESMGIMAATSAVALHLVAFLRARDKQDAQKFSPLPHSFDARVWAREFQTITRDQYGLTLDLDWLVTWFSNSIMAGYDHAQRTPPEGKQVILGKDSNYSNLTARERLMISVKQTNERCLEIMRKKNADYSGGTGDPYANFRSSTIYGIHPVIGMLMRIGDKFQRVRSFVEKGELQVKDESVKDSIEDAINYLHLILGFLNEEELNRPKHWTDGITPEMAAESRRIKAETERQHSEKTYRDQEIQRAQGPV